MASMASHGELQVIPSDPDPNDVDVEFIHQLDESTTKTNLRIANNASVEILNLPSSLTDSEFSSSTSDMTFPSSPVLYPASSSPPAAVPTRKRRLFQPFPTAPQPQPKKPRIVGGFLQDSDGEDDEEGVSIAKVTSAETLPTIGQTNQPAQEDIRRQDETATPSSVPVQQVDLPSPPLLPAPRLLLRKLPPKTISIQSASGRATEVPIRQKSAALSYEQIIAQRSTTAPGRAKKAYYGIDIHALMDEAKTQRQLDDFAKESEKQKPTVLPSVEVPGKNAVSAGKSAFTQMWTEKYRAKKFTELVGDERTHRSVLRWLKSWDDLVFPGSTRTKHIKVYDEKDQSQQQHKKILLLTGPPGLGKTTLAHVCAKQAGYEVLEINASDDRSRDVVKGRIKDSLGTETVRGIKEHGQARKAGRPVCVVVDEVDGVTTGSSSSGGEGGFVKALIDLVQLDQRNSSKEVHGQIGKGGKRNRDQFRMLRPLILVCNDVYAPSLRPLRTSSIAEIVHVRKAPIDKVISRIKFVFEKERISCDNDAARRLCENAWGLAMRKQRGHGARGAGEGDIRGVLVQAEWIAHKLRAAGENAKLTRNWLEPHLDNSQQGQKGLGRGGVREVVERIFVEGAGLPNLPTSVSAEDARLIAESKSNPIGVSDLRKRTAITALREMVDTCGDHDRLMTDCFATYPTQVFQDDVQLSKPNSSYEWLHFHDRLSSRIFSGQEWELTPYLSSSACGFHHLFATMDKGTRGWHEDTKLEDEEDLHPFSGLKADFAAYEAEKQNRTLLTELQSNFSGSMLRLFSSVDAIALELIPNIGRMLAPDVKPVVIGGSGGSASVASVRKETEKQCVRNSVKTMLALDVSFEKVRVEIEGGGAHSNGGYIYRMEP
jgi:chromosome transmission fidelity protein 18